MYVQVIGQAPMALLVWTAHGAFEVVAQASFGELLIALLLALLVTLTAWSWWTGRLDRLD